LERQAAGGRSLIAREKSVEGYVRHRQAWYIGAKHGEHLGSRPVKIPLCVIGIAEGIKPETKYHSL